MQRWYFSLRTQEKKKKQWAFGSQILVFPLSRGRKLRTFRPVFDGSHSPWRLFLFPNGLLLSIFPSGEKRVERSNASFQSNSGGGKTVGFSACIFTVFSPVKRPPHLTSKTCHCSLGKKNAQLSFCVLRNWALQNSGVVQSLSSCQAARLLSFHLKKVFKLKKIFSARE